ncbi:TolB family protein [Chitinophaga lutea]
MKTYLLPLAIACLPAVHAAGQDTAFAAPRFLTAGNGFTDYWPCVFPDGQQVLFSRKTGEGQWAFYRVPVSGGKATAFLPGFPASATRASVAPNGGVAFTAAYENKPGQLYLTDTSGSAFRYVAVQGLKGGPVYPSWTPHERSVVVVAYQQEQGGRLAEIDLASGKAAYLTSFENIRCGMPDVSPDGSRIAMAAQRAADADTYDQTKNAIWIRDKSGLKRLVPGQGRAPKWSPDGKWIAYESIDNSPDGQYAIFIVSADGSRRYRVSDYKWNANHPVWSPDGRSLVISAVHPGGKGSRIAVIPVPAYVRPE